MLRTGALKTPGYRPPGVFYCCLGVVIYFPGGIGVEYETNSPVHIGFLYWSHLAFSNTIIITPVSTLRHQSASFIP